MSNKNKTQTSVDVEKDAEGQPTQQPQTITRDGGTYQIRYINGLTVENRVN